MLSTALSVWHAFTWLLQQLGDPHLKYSLPPSYGYRNRYYRDHNLSRMAENDLSPGTGASEPTLLNILLCCLLLLRASPLFQSPLWLLTASSPKPLPLPSLLTLPPWCFSSLLTQPPWSCPFRLGLVFFPTSLVPLEQDVKTWTRLGSPMHLL